jgi:hypothetical protein
MKPTVNLCCFATGRYREFLPPFLESAYRFFCADFGPTFHIWTEPERPFTEVWSSRQERHVHCRDPRYCWHPLPHEPWPGITLHRWSTMLAQSDSLLESDFTFFCDVDMRFLRPVGEEILSDLVAVLHAGFFRDPPHELPFERRLESRACVLLSRGKCYYAGGFQGGRTKRWLSICREMDDWTRCDEEQGIIPVAHDESYWNCYLSRLPQAPRADCRSGAPLLLPYHYCAASEGHWAYDPRNARLISMPKSQQEWHV